MKKNSVFNHSFKGETNSELRSELQLVHDLLVLHWGHTRQPQKKGAVASVTRDRRLEDLIGTGQHFIHETHAGLLRCMEKLEIKQDLKQECYTALRKNVNAQLGQSKARFAMLCVGGKLAATHDYGTTLFLYTLIFIRISSFAS